MPNHNTYLTDRTLRYWTPAQVRLYMNTPAGPLWIDDAAGIDVRIEDQKTPHYGFADQYFRTVSHGRTLVTGNLYIHFRFPNYLSTAIRKASGPPPPKDRFGNQIRGVAHTASFLPVLDAVPTESTLTQLGRLLQENYQTYTDYSEDLKRIFYRETIDASTDLPSFERNRPSELQTQLRTSFDVQIKYGSEHNYGEPLDDGDRTFTEYVRGIYIVGTSKPILMVDGGGDRSILEVYSFIARNVEAQEL